MKNKYFMRLCEIKMYELKDYLNAVNHTKEPLMDTEDEQWEKKYPPFIVNKCLAPFQDTIMLVNEINQLHHLDKKLQYDFLLNSDFLKVRETLSRIGVASRKERKLYQSCHILHKQGKYYIVHFKELFALDGKKTNITINDMARRNTIAILLRDWGLISILSDVVHEPAPLSQIKVLAYKEKGDWTLETKYNIGKKRE